MGAWSTSITGNDTAMDLRSEYTAAFYAYDVPEALEKIDAYVRSVGFDESDPEEWCNYFYSLADFMWKKGILTGEVRDRVIEMIDSGFGLELWAESGASTLKARKKALDKLRAQLLTPLPPKKKIKPDVYVEDVFTPGDLIAIQLKTSGKSYGKNWDMPMTDEEFHSCDSKFVLIQKIRSLTSWTSRIASEISDHWGVFRLFDGVYDSVPTDVDIRSLKDAAFLVNQSMPLLFDDPRASEMEYTPPAARHFSPLFDCESSMALFKRRKAQVLGNYPEAVPAYLDMPSQSAYLASAADEEFLSAMGREPVCSPFCSSIDALADLVRSANRYSRYDYRLSPEQNEEKFLAEETAILDGISRSIAAGAQLYQLHYGHTLGVISVLGNEIDAFYIEGRYQGYDFGAALLKHVLETHSGKLCMNVPKNNRMLLRVCEKADMTRTVSLKPGFIKMIRK